MPYICYEDWRPSRKSRALVDKANEIIGEYMADGFQLTLRQLYYQFVARDIIENSQRSYKRLGSLISKARRAGLIDWSAIVDRTRQLLELQTWADPDDIVADSANVYREPIWQHQPAHVEVWIEKDALVGVFQRVCEEWRVPLFSCRGYASDSEVWSHAQRIARLAEDKQDVYLLHFGDHDPSGVDMTRDIDERLTLFGSFGANVQRLALNMDQVRQYGPPPNPAKVTDSRYEHYARHHGDESWELDALEPQVLAGLVSGFIESVIDQDEWDESMAAEESNRKTLQTASLRWADVREFLAQE